MTRARWNESIVLEYTEWKPRRKHVATIIAGVTSEEWHE